VDDVLEKLPREPDFPHFGEATIRICSPQKLFNHLIYTPPNTSPTSHILPGRSKPAYSPTGGYPLPPGKKREGPPIGEK